MLAATATAVLALVAIAAYAIDWAGLGVQPWASLAVAIALVALVAMFLPRRSGASADVFAWLAIAVFVIAILLRVSWPELVPPGRGPDLTHHLLLVDYIEEQGHLVHDRSLSAAMGEMAHYTPAAHVLAVIAGQWFGIDGWRAFFPLVVLCAALTAGFVFLIARRLLLDVPMAIAATILLFLPAPYFSGAFTHDAYLAQTVATLFAVAMWWALTVWSAACDVRGAGLNATSWLVSIFLAATFLSWPVFLGPPLLVFAGLLMQANLSPPARRRHLAIVVLPMLAMFLVHSWERWGWMVIVRTSGAVMHPTMESLGWALPVLAAFGAMVALSDRRARVTAILLFVIAVQSITFFIIAKSQGADTPYMALKMFYFAIYPMAVLAAFGLARLIGRSRMSETIGWMVAAVLLVAVRPAFSDARPVPVVDRDLYAAGKQARAQGIAECVDYLVGDAETAYWLHLAVLGNPRSTARTQALDTFEPRAAMAPWITADGGRYAIADLRLLPDEIRSRIDIPSQFGHAALITRRGVTIKGCD